MTESNCASGVPLLMDYLEGLVAADVRSALEQHVAGCAKCTAFIASYLSTPRIIREATAVSLPAEGQRSLQQFLLDRIRGS